ncbi:MAG: methyltransferase domain-containing protein [Ilumatobacteraceae bacterium]|nr:methyltransferase domain-containing protein [Ilumatobacteraceae bacterium]MDP4702161.1 methyltransferase domain-containing protein [Ilumatobacteraceae bacterium]MDP5108179.1 methyltransferase domain-containing protein [Ilumatobacteraceae bacterium]
MSTRDFWNEKYANTDYAYGTEPNEFLVSAVAKLKRGETLSLAEGEGRNAVWLAQQGFTVSSIEQSEKGVAKTLRLALQRGVIVMAERGELETFNIQPNSWDLMVSIYAHTPQELRRKLHRQVVAGLKPGGVFILEAYTPAQIPNNTGGPKDASLMPTAELLRSELHGLVFDHLEEIERDVVEGSLHTGTAHVVQLVAHRAP